MLSGLVVSGGDRCHIACAHDVLANLLKAVDYQNQHFHRAIRTEFTYDDAHGACRGLLGHSTRGRDVREFDSDNVGCGTCQSYSWPLVFIMAASD